MVQDKILISIKLTGFVARAVHILDIVLMVAGDMLNIKLDVSILISVPLLTFFVLLNDILDLFKI